MSPSLRREFSRKALHLTSSLIPLLYWLVFSRRVVLIVVCALLGVSLLIEISRGVIPVFRRAVESWLGHMLRSAERRQLSGATWVLAAAALSVALFDKPVAVTVLLFLSVSDSLAALIGARFGRATLWGKSLAGSSAFLVSAFLIARLTTQLSVPATLLVAAIATAAEAVPIQLGPLRVNDNLAIPLVSGLAMTLAS
ncbi:MAG: SEC59/DGK1/VTE5 family protein [Phycisphaerae bacterium]